MPYCTLDNLSDRYGTRQLVSLTDRAEVPTNVVDTDVIDRAIADADALIDGYLAARYGLPLAQTPPIVANLSMVIAIWNLHLFDPPQKVKDDYAQAMKALMAISQGSIKLEVAGIEPQGSGSGGVTITDRDRPLSADKMKGFI